MKRIPPLVLSMLALVLMGASPSSRATVPMTDDATINLSRPDQNEGQNPGLHVRNVGNDGVLHGFVKFDVSSLPPDASIRQATLRLWVSQVLTPGAITLHEILTDWEEGTVTANTAPFIAPSFARLPITARDQHSYVTIDITPIVRGWM